MEVDEDSATDEDEELQKQVAASKKRKAPAPTTTKSTAAKPKAPPKKKAKKGTGGIDLGDGTIDSDDDGQPNEYDYNDGFLVPNDASLEEENSRRLDDDDALALREAKVLSLLSSVLKTREFSFFAFLHPYSNTSAMMKVPPVPIIASSLDLLD